MELEALEQEVGGRNDGGAKRRQIMEGARQVFLSGGFDGASMNDVARAAGVSKGTLYAYFNSKDELFEAIIRVEYAQAAERLCTFKREGDVREMLTDFGVRLISRMAEPGTRALARVVIAAVEKFPNIGRAFYEAGPLYGATRLAAELAKPRKVGRPSTFPIPSAPPGNSSTSARAMSTSASCSAWSNSISREDIEASVEAGVDVFLRAYGV